MWVSGDFMDIGLCSFLSWEGINEIRSKMNTKKDIEYERNDKRKRYVMCFLSWVGRSKSKVCLFYH